MGEIGSGQRCCWPLNADPLDDAAEPLIEAVSLIAEIAVGIAGFAGVATVLGRGPGQWGAGDSVRIRLLLTAAFTAMFAALAAVGADWAGAGVEASVQVGAAAVLFGQAYFSFGLGRQVRRLDPSDLALFNPRLAVSIRIIVYASMCAQLLALTGIAIQISRGLFLFGLLVCLAYAALGFVRLMFVRPSAE